MNPVLKPVLKQLNELILGKEDVIVQLLTCILAKGHVLLEDMPGMGKTTLAHALAIVLGLKYQRIQFTNDMLPADLLGVSIFQPQNGEFVFHPGPVFHSFLLADEINRASPKLQSALLEAMEEGQVSIDGQTHPLPKPFLVVATQNPVEQLGTYPLPEAQLDRFMMRLSLGYPIEKAEKYLYLHGDRRFLIPKLQQVANESLLCQWQQEAASVKIAPAAVDYVYRLVQATRENGYFEVGLSPRAGLAILAAAKAYAWIVGREHILPEDIKKVWVAVTAHRLQPAQADKTSITILNGILRHVAVV